jgi:hypothetical protein
MNTPPPCNTCIHLYYDCVYKDNPNYEVNCQLKLPMGQKCKKYKVWTKK